MSDREIPAGEYQKHGRFVPALGAPVLQLLAVQPGERILDLGCGDGELTARIAAAGATVVGVDASEPLLEAARARGLDARQMNGEALEFDGEFDAVFSNAALHWMLKADAVIAGVKRALKPGGRFVGEMGGKGNVASIMVALMAVLEKEGAETPRTAPWYFPTPDEYRQKLEAHGFEVPYIELIPRPTKLDDAGMPAWLETFGRPMLTQLPEEAREGARDHAVELLKPALADTSGQWTADYVRLRFKACAVRQ
jgi:trans-aconitate methyltransferase